MKLHITEEETEEIDIFEILEDEKQEEIIELKNKKFQHLYNIVLEKRIKLDKTLSESKKKNERDKMLSMASKKNKEQAEHVNNVVNSFEHMMKRLRESK